MTVEFADRVRLVTRAVGRAVDILYYLAVHADNDHIVREISHQELAEQFQFTVRRARQIVQGLRELGEVETIKRGSGKSTNVYRIHLRHEQDAV